MDLLTYLLTYLVRVVTQESKVTRSI